MDNMSPQQRQDAHSPGGAQQENKRRSKSQSYRRQSAPSLVLTKALTRSKTLSRESFLLPVCPESCQLVQSFLAGSDRSFLLHGHAQLKTGMQSQDRHLFLFNDIMVIAKAKSANHFKQKAQVCVCEMWTAGCIDEVCEGSTNPERSFVMGWPTCNYVATFSSAEQKERWLSLLKSRIKEEKEREEPKTIPLRVYGKGINTFAVTKTLPVSNWDSTNEVVRLALQQFSIIGNVKDFQLWVISKRDNTPYPLIGHEFPFSIQMSHVGHSSMSAPADRQRTVEQMQVYKQCQFIMRPRTTDTLNESAEFSQKQFKRRRSLIGWAFWRGSSSHLNEMSLAGAAQGCLYGQPLSSVCVEDALPKPVMDMLAFLYHEGSWTRGIFRRPAGARAVRELRDSLDSGECTLPLTTDHAFLIAGVFKDFLRSIPGSLLCCELHEDWIDVLEEDEDDREQVQDIKRMISRVPKENALLLRYLLAMLHGVQDNAQENQMTTFNLSVCIAPSMLWPPGEPSSPEAEGEGTKKVCELVKFMIEHCEQIVGQEPSSLFGGPPQRLNADETGSDSWHYPLTDSSYDSLENELDNSSGGSPSFCSTRDLGPKLLQGSLDSILAFSDYDQDTDPDPYKSQPDSRPGLKLHRVGGTRRPSLDLHNPRPRRSSEPAIAYAAKFRPYLSGNTGEDEEELSKPSSHTLTPSLTLHGVAPPPNSPAPSLSSLDSEPLCSDHTWVTRRGLHPAKTHLHSPVIATPSSAHPPDLGSCPKGSPPKEAISWGTLKGCKGLHPNTWLKKGRRFSLTQQENEEEDHSGGGVIEKSLTLEKVDERGGHSKPKTSCSASKDAGVGSHGRGRPQHLKQDSSPPSHHRSTGSLHFPKAESEGNEIMQPSPLPSLFYKQSGPSLSLFKQSKSYSVEEEHNSRLYQRRGSEPGWQVVDRASTLTRARLPSDPGLKVTDVDSHGGTPDSRFCLSPHTTKTVKAYFSAHQRSNPQSSQQVALSLVESHREWLKRCSDPKTEADFDQLLFAEESYV